MLVVLIALITFNVVNVSALNDEPGTKEKIINNMKRTSEESKQNKYKEEYKKVGKLGEDADYSEPIESIDELVDNVANVTENIFIATLNGISRISIYIALLSVIIGIIGCVFTRNAPLLRKWFVGIMIAGPLIFLLSTYGPAFYFAFVSN